MTATATMIVRRADHLRVTVEPAPPQPTALARDWWNSIAGNPPDAHVEEPQTGVVRVFGRLADAPLFMTAAPKRLDIARPFAVPGQPTVLSGLPDFDDALPPFLEVVGHWLELKTAPTIGRLALSVDTFEPCSGIEDCRERLDGYLPTVDMQATPPSEFEYRVNRQGSVADVAVNRIAKWSTQQIQDAVDGAVYAIQLEIDINSAPGRTEALTQPASLLEEFAGFARQFARKGDRL